MAHILVFCLIDTTHTPVDTRSLHDALPIFALRTRAERVDGGYLLTGTKAWVTSGGEAQLYVVMAKTTDRKSTRLNSSHVKISYAVFCLKKKKKFDANRKYSSV